MSRPCFVFVSFVYVSRISAGVLRLRLLLVRGNDSVQSPQSVDYMRLIFVFFSRLAHAYVEILSGYCTIEAFRVVLLGRVLFVSCIAHGCARILSVDYICRG